MPAAGCAGRARPPISAGPRPGTISSAGTCRTGRRAARCSTGWRRCRTCACVTERPSRPMCPGWTRRSAGSPMAACVAAKLVVAADGRDSTLRRLAGIGCRRWGYGQKALVFAVTHPDPHGGVSTEIHRTGGPLTLVPMPDHDGRPCSSVVWMVPGPRANALAALDDAGLGAELTAETMGLFGPLRIVSPRAVWPIVAQLAHRLVAQRLALIAEAAHVVPPIGAQGLNMSLADIETLARRHLWRGRSGRSGAADPPSAPAVPGDSGAGRRHRPPQSRRQDGIAAAPRPPRPRPRRDLAHRPAATAGDPSGARRLITSPEVPDSSSSPGSPGRSRAHPGDAPVKPAHDVG